MKQAGNSLRMIKTKRPTKLQVLALGSALFRVRVTERPRLKGGGRGALECKRLIEADETSGNSLRMIKTKPTKLPGFSLGSV
jgi:hypothetical protein